MTGNLGRLTKAKRIVIKIGSALLVDQESGAIRRDWLAALAEDIAALHDQGKQVAVVSSGAIAAGRRHLGLTGRTLRLEEKQAAAATGQIRLAHAYEEALARHNITVAQILVTLDDTEERRRHLNARSTLNQLLALGAVPLINENDTVATQEIRYGDNDRLAARVAAMISADVLVLLSDIDGMYEADPRKAPDAKYIPEIGEITAEIEAMAGAAPEGYSSGGMITKVAAARIALGGGCHMALAEGHSLNPVRRLMEGGRCTWFVASANPRTARKRWIAGSLKPAGELIVDKGAENALAKGSSLLPAGVAKVKGRFDRGDLVTLRSLEGKEIGRGLAAYGDEDAKRIAGHKTGEIEEILGYRGRDEIVHRDDLALD
ncbi:MAG: glutamate 5-kinase [Alphaproteobacteria bacterium]|nr:glutamate 5-kinase [Alphaproteobacteria bacterium]